MALEECAHGACQDNGIVRTETQYCEDVLRKYFQSFVEQDQFTDVNKEAFDQDGNDTKKVSGIDTRKTLIQELCHGLNNAGLRQCRNNAPPLAENQPLIMEDSDGEEVGLCHQCRLPLGDKAYRRDRMFFHGECIAQMIAYHKQDEEKTKQRKARQEKNVIRAEYGIGWDVHHIPHNQGPAGKLAMRQVPDGLVCLVVEEEARSICIASTMEPAAAVNLEYLSTALEVRRREGHEPIFSLDPVDPTNRNSMQAKVFVPEWLAGTSAGEVLFQADYYLKELSMGEYEQPVVGMKSCFDHAEVDKHHYKAWNAREWFHVRKAEVQLSDSSVLIPYVKMGVEAREQVFGVGGLRDKHITRPDHPMVKYAEAFTKNFDLIAERRSVIYHLRELAKASVLAKHLFDAAMELSKSWFQLAEGDWACSLEVPQLWNEREYSQVHIQNGALVRNTDQNMSRVHGVYGGVMFGLDRLNVARTVPLSAAASRLGMSNIPMPGSYPPIGRQALFAAASTSAIPSRLRIPASIASQAPDVKATEEAPNIQVPALQLPQYHQASVSTGKLPLPARAVPSFAASLAAQQPVAAVVAPGRPTVAAVSFDKFDLSTAVTRSDAVAEAMMPARPSVRATVAVPAAMPSGLTERIAAFDRSRKASVAPITTVSAMASGAAFVPPKDIDPLKGVARRPATAARRLLQDKAADIIQGVDLCLDVFDLSMTKQVAHEARCAGQSLDHCCTIGNAFWNCFEDAAGASADGDYELLKDIFNPELSDRRSEAELFIPPDASYSSIARLRALVKEEEKVRQRRKEHFFSKDFSTERPGSMFPASWTPSCEIALGRSSSEMSENRDQRTLKIRPEFKHEAAAILQTVLKSSLPIFDRITEDGLRFLIYQLGNLEVRSVQDLNGEETIGVVFSVCTPESAKQREEPVKTRDRITKATEYVERVCATSNNGPILSFQYFVVLETERNHMIGTELLSDGTVCWNENEVNLEDRCSLAKVTRSAENCSGVTVKEIRIHASCFNTEADQAGKVSGSTRKRFARKVFNLVTKMTKK